MPSPLRLAVVAGYNSSKHAIAIVNGIMEIDSVQLLGVGYVRWFATGRIRHLLRKYGLKNAWEKFRNVTSENHENRFYDETRYISQYLAQKNIRFGSLTEICRRLNFRCVPLASVNDVRWLEWLKTENVDVLVYSGGGILKRNALDSVKIGVLNAHGGPLPFFRGMNGMEWSLAYGAVPEITVHLIDRGIDTGPVLMRDRLSIDQGDTISKLRGKSTVKEVESLLTVIRSFNHYFDKRQIQKLEEGQQFFVMHPFIKDVLDKKLIAGWRPFKQAKDVA